MPSLTAIRLIPPPEIVPVGHNLYVRKNKRKNKFGLRDKHLHIDLLAMVYDRIDHYPGTTYLMVYLDDLVGIYDILLRMWLVPIKFTSIYLTKSPRQFIVYLDRKRGLYDGITNRVMWL